MAIKFFKSSRFVNINGVSHKKYIAKTQTETNIGLDMMAEMIEKKSTVSRGDIMAVLSELESSTCFMLENGHPVTLGILGTFYPSVEVMAVDTPEEVTVKTILRFKTIFKPSKYLKKRFKNVEFVLGDNKVREVNYKKNKNSQE